MTSFSATAALKNSWQIFKARWTWIYGLGLVMILISFLINGLIASSDHYGLTDLIAQIINLLMSAAGILATLAIVRGDRPTIDNSVKPLASWKKIGRYILGSIAVTVVVVLGMLLLIIPGIIWSLKYMYVPVLLLEEEISIKEAFRRSAAMTNGHKWQLAGMEFLSIGVFLAGLLALVVGLFVAVPVIAIMPYVAYEMLKIQSSESPETLAQV